MYRCAGYERSYDSYGNDFTRSRVKLFVEENAFYGMWRTAVVVVVIVFEGLVD